MKPTLWSRLAYMVMPERRRQLVRRLEIALEEGAIDLGEAYATFDREVAMWWLFQCPLSDAASRGIPKRVERLIREAK